MTDKERIKEAVSRLIVPENKCKGMSKTDVGRQYAYREVVDIIDSMKGDPQVKESAELQHDKETCKENGDSLTREPVNEVWHNMSEEAENGRNIIIIDPKDFYGVVLRKGGSQLRNHNKERYVKWAYIDDIINITNKEEPVSEDLEEASLRASIIRGQYIPKEYLDEYPYDAYAQSMFKRGAKWQAEQFEKNRLKHCDSITNEQAELEQGFIGQHLDKHQRMPTFLDAIEYGMRLQKEQMMAKAVDGEVTYGKSLAIPSLGWVLDKEGLDFSDKVKLIIIKQN